MTESNEVPFLVLGEGDETPSRTKATVAVYAYDDPTRLIDVVPARWDVKCLDEIGKEGGGSFTVWAHDKRVTPELLHWRNIVKVSVNGRVVGAFLIQRRKRVFASRNESSGEVWEISGEGLRTYFHDAVVHPYGGIRADAYGARVFSFASERGDWYKEDDWITPVKLAQHSLDPNPSPWNTAPARWPDAPSAWWVWGVYNDKTTHAPLGYNYFRYEFDIDESVGTREYSVFAAGDNRLKGYIDGQQIIEVEETTGWRSTTRADFELHPGHHVLAFRVQNVGGPAALIAALFRVGDAATETPAQLLTVTGDAGWTVNPYPDPAPGWTPGEIMLRLLEEADARGVKFPDMLSPTFTSEVDSYGLPWSRALDWEFSIGMEYFEVIERLEEAVCDLWIDPETLALHMAERRGVDRTQQSSSVTPVAFRIGHNIAKAEESGTAEIKNALVLNTTDGWLKTTDALSDSIDDYGVVEGTLSTGLSAFVSGDVAQSVFRQRALPTRAVSIDIVDKDHARPFIDFNAGDWVLAPDDDGQLTPVRILSLALAEDGASGQPVYAVEFGTIEESIADRHERWLKTLANDSLGGTVANAGGGSGSSANGGGGTPRAQVGGEGSEGPRGEQGEHGPAGANYTGTWSSATTYSQRDVVLYDRALWYSLQDGNANKTPGVSPTFWTLFLPEGTPGSGIVWKGAWVSSTVYSEDDAVSHNGSSWVAKQSSTGQAPSEGVYWTVLAAKGSDGDTGPQGPQGPPGEDGEGLPAVGDEGDVLTVVGGEWAPAPPAAGGGSDIPDPSSEPDGLVLTTQGGEVVWLPPTGGGGAGLDATGIPFGYVPKARGDDTWEWLPEDTGGGGGGGSGGGALIDPTVLDDAILADAPEAYWTDYQGQDLSGSNRHLTWVNRPYLTVSPLTGRLVLMPNGTETGTANGIGYIESASWMNTGSVTVEAVIEYRRTGQGAVLVGRDQAGARAWRVDIDSSSILKAIYWPGGALSQPSTGVTVTPGPHHVAFTYNASTGVMCLYLDGEKVFTETKSGNLPNVTGRITVGGTYAGGSPSTTNIYNSVTFPMQSVAVYGGALSSAQILAHAEASGVLGPPPSTRSALLAGSTGTVALSSVARILSLTTTGACRVRLYRTAEQRTADASRPVSTPPVGDAVLADHVVEAAGTYWTNPIYQIARSGSVFYYAITGSALVTLAWQEI